MPSIRTDKLRTGSLKQEQVVNSIAKSTQDKVGTYAKNRLIRCLFSDPSGVGIEAKPRKARLFMTGLVFSVAAIALVVVGLFFPAIAFVLPVLGAITLIKTAILPGAIAAGLFILSVVSHKHGSRPPSKAASNASSSSSSSSSSAQKRSQETTSQLSSSPFFAPLGEDDLSEITSIPQSATVKSVEESSALSISSKEAGQVGLNDLQTLSSPSSSTLPSSSFSSSTASSPQLKKSRISRPKFTPTFSIL